MGSWADDSHVGFIGSGEGKAIVGVGEEGQAAKAQRKVGNCAKCEFGALIGFTSSTHIRQYTPLYRLPLLGGCQKMTQILQQQFSRIVASLRDRPGLPEERAAPRFARTELEARVLVARWRGRAVGQPLSVLARDISISDMTCVSGELFVIGEEVVHLLPREGSTYVAVLATVTACDEVTYRLYQVTSTFTRVLSIEETREVAWYFLNNGQEAALSPRNE